MLLAPAQKIALLPALAAACAYGSISGFGLPAQRALVMAAVFMLASLFNIKQPASLRFLLAMAVVLTLNPLSFLGMGFWLSFLAVAALLLSQRPDPRPTGPTTWLMASLRPQLAVAAGLLVPLLFWMGEVSLLGPLVNIPAIPLVGFCVVPLCLLAACSIPFSETLAETLLQPATWLLQLLLWSLKNAVALGSDIAILDRGAPATLTLALLAAGSLLALMPKGFPGRHLTPLLMFPLLFTPAKAPREDLLRLHILDVGQGLAIIVQTRRHTLLYDTGASFSPNASMGDRVVLPVLKKMNTPKLDAVVLSHSDDDHSRRLPSHSQNPPHRPPLQQLQSPPGHQPNLHLPQLHKLALGQRKFPLPPPQHPPGNRQRQLLRPPNPSRRFHRHTPRRHRIHRRTQPGRNPPRATTKQPANRSPPRQQHLIKLALPKNDRSRLCCIRCGVPKLLRTSLAASTKKISRFHLQSVKHKHRRHDQLRAAWPRIRPTSHQFPKGPPPLLARGPRTT